MRDHNDLLQRIDRLSARAQQRYAEPGIVAEMNDLLSEGFAQALKEEARLDELEQRLADVLSDVSPARASELRRITVESRATQRGLDRLRTRLARMHERYIELATVAGRR
jgi:ADP-ribose pyrophosphatase YjhB (NUDIX family)